ncbi:hypothetical protein Hypma_012598 [Hypsizygus marmoreus]|uniref:F-box domain-containing protein n=1 Tax=Hypsizygus marmoreus TaxID=39966 RepID=A0A369JKU9_HYPMA|nr:hypothetical protein Hypma_012598 [Hypsizygus marmoreus]
MSSSNPFKAQTLNRKVEIPPELVHEIFRYAAQISTPFCLTLCRVSSWTHELALPHLYSTAIIKNHQQNSQFIACLQRSPFTSIRQSDFEPALAVRDLWVEAVSDIIVDIFKACDNLKHIALHADNLLWLVHSSTPGQARTRRLADEHISRKQDLEITVVKGNDWALSRYENSQDQSLTSTLFGKITRLRARHVGDYAQHLNISHYTRLTHLAIPFYLPFHDLLELDRIMEHPSLEALVIVIIADLILDNDLVRLQEWYLEKEKVQRSLKLSLVTSNSDRLQEEWEAEVRGGRSLWDRL